MTRNKPTIVQNLSLYSLSLVEKLTAADKPPTQSRHFYLDFANDDAGGCILMCRCKPATLVSSLLFDPVVKV